MAFGGLLEAASGVRASSHLVAQRTAFVQRNILGDTAGHVKPIWYRDPLPASPPQDSALDFCAVATDVRSAFRRRPLPD